MEDLIRAVGRLSGCLHSLSVRMERAPLNGWLSTLDSEMSSPVPSNLVSLRIDGLRSSGIPTWVERLYKLQKITLCNTTLTDEKLGALSELPVLVCLRLRHKSYNGRELAFRKPGGFPSLKFLRIEDVLVVTELSFQPNSMPKLQEIVWSLADHSSNDALVAAITVSVAGVENLPNLKNVVLKGLREHHPSTLTKDIAKHPNRPVFSRHGH
jgi:disease resistance protein RPM1